MGTTAARRLLPTTCAVLVLLHIGAPGFGAIDRAISRLFAEVNWAAAAPESPTDRDVDPRTISLTCASTELCLLAGQPQQDSAAPTRRPRPPGALIPLYISFGVLQAMDVHSTFAALERGGVERSPLAAGLVNRPAAFIAVKAGTSAGAVYLAEQIRPHSRVGAIVLMGALNSLYAIAVTHNYRMAAR